MGKSILFLLIIYVCIYLSDCKSCCCKCKTPTLPANPPTPPANPPTPPTSPAHHAAEHKNPLGQIPLINSGIPILDKGPTAPTKDASLITLVDSILNTGNTNDLTTPSGSPSFIKLVAQLLDDKYKDPGQEGVINANLPILTPTS